MTDSWTRMLRVEIQFKLDYSGRLKDVKIEIVMIDVFFFEI
jgi:hypothetical protein